MTAAFSQRDQYRIEADAWKAFNCAPTAAGSKKESRALLAKRTQVSSTIAKGMAVFESESPPKSREQAIRAIVGVVAMLLSAIFPQYRLAISIAGWLWDYLHGDPAALEIRQA
jgi:hypothetical protein